MGKLQGSIQRPLYGCLHIHYWFPLEGSMMLYIPPGQQKNITVHLLNDLFCEFYQALLLDILWQELPKLIFCCVRKFFINCRCMAFRSYWRSACVAWGQVINRHPQLSFFLYVSFISFIKSSLGSFFLYSFESNLVQPSQVPFMTLLRAFETASLSVWCLYFLGREWSKTRWPPFSPTWGVTQDLPV